MTRPTPPQRSHRRQRDRPARFAAEASLGAAGWLLSLIALSACQPPTDQLGQLFLSSQGKPVSGDKRSLPRSPVDQQRRSRRLALLRGELSADKWSLLGPQGAALADRQLEIEAGPLAIFRLHLGAGQTISATTRALSEGLDPVLHLWSIRAQRSVASDDDSGDEPGAARLNTTIERDGEYLLIAHAYSAEDSGVCDIALDQRTLARDVALGGSGLSVAAGQTIEAVLQNDREGSYASTDPLILVLDRATAQLKQVDDDSGVELGARLALGEESWVIVGSLDAASAGHLSLLLHDPRVDSDGDGLGDGLERGRCLCAVANEITACGFDCRAARTAQDSDGDGLSDAAELRGIDDPAFPQLLPRWGANPLHKDLFVEVDLAQWIDSKADPAVLHFGRPPTISDASLGARAFARLPEMGNPDQLPGVALHLDTGEPCASLPLGINADCGPLCSLDQSGRRICGTTPYAPNNAGHRAGLSTQRRGLFHVAVSDCLIAGSAPGSPADHLEYDCDRISAMVHELGHNLGLRHYGDPGTGTGNCKPNYPSVMNYAYSDRFAGGREIHFSTGEMLGDGGELDPRNIDETRRLGGPNADISWLAARPFYYTLFDCLEPPARGCRVDFNRDGRIDSSVRAYLSPMPNYGAICENDHGNARQVLDIDGIQPSAGAAALVSELASGAKLFVFAPVPADEDSARLRVASRNLVDGQWSGWRDLTATSFRADAQPAAVLDPAASEIWLVASDRAGALRWLRMTLEAKVKAEQTLEGIPEGFRTRDVALLRHDDQVLLVTRGENGSFADRLYYTAYHGGRWQPLRSVRDKTHQLRSWVTPALASGPRNELYLALADPQPPTGPAGRLHLYQGDTLDLLHDSEALGVRFADGLPNSQHVPYSRPALEFIRHRDGNGQPLSDGRGYLALWWQTARRARWATTWGRLDQQGADFRIGRWHHYEAQGFIGTPAGGSPALVSYRGQLSALLASQWKTDKPTLRFVPFADGVPDSAAPSRDFDDRPAIRKNLCVSLNAGCVDRCDDLRRGCPKDQRSEAARAAPAYNCLLPRAR
ncbi:MAG: hypothetical protein H6707_07155 [Deltaproteobacteria bacterium]|nr:hypothetical protein [Deltaproteobacteria bacterium]